jgi:signal transduction histidine kinase
LNLLINALRFSPENTSIIVSIRVDNKWVKIQVSDQGPGVSESIRTTLFHSGITTSQPGGTNVGLGLHFVQRVADAHGGKIELIDTGDHGSTFELSLPIVQSQEKKGAQT